MYGQLDRPLLTAATFTRRIEFPPSSIIGQVVVGYGCTEGHKGEQPVRPPDGYADHDIADEREDDPGDAGHHAAHSNPSYPKQSSKPIRLSDYKKYIA